MSYYLGELAIGLYEHGIDVFFCKPLCVVYAGDASITYDEECDVFLVEKGDDADIFEVDTPVDEMIDWVRS